MDKKFLVVAVLFLGVISLLTLMDFAIENTLELQEGKWYKYEITKYGGTTEELNIFLTEENEKAWEGIVGVEESFSNKIVLLNFKIDKKNLFLHTSLISNFSQLDEEPEYMSFKNFTRLGGLTLTKAFYPFFFSLVKSEANFNIQNLFKEGFTEIEYSGSKLSLNVSGKVENDRGEFWKVAWYPSGQESKLITLAGTVKPYMISEISSDEPGSHEGMELGEIKGFELEDIKNYYSDYELVKELEPIAKKVEEEEETSDCAYASLSIQDAIYSSNKNNLIVSVANTGTMDFENVSVYVFVDGSYKGTRYASSLSTADVKTVTMDDLSSKPTKVKAISQSCPSVSDELTESEISTK